MQNRIGILILIAVSFVALNAAINTASCTGCHGKNFEKSAMGKSKIVAEMSQIDISKALVGYKNGTYGGNMKNIMKMQVSKYSEKELLDTGLGKVETKKTAKLANKSKKTSKSNIVFEHKNILGFKESNICWVVDFKTKRSKLLKCKRIESALKLKTNSLVPPTFGDIPNPFDGLLK